jgi:hypothetical protein
MKGKQDTIIKSGENKFLLNAYKLRPAGRVGRIRFFFSLNMIVN